jgi:hypothetical protein
VFNWDQLVRLSEAEIAEKNLACAADLPASELIDISRCLRWLDDAARMARWRTERSMPLYEQNPAAYANSRNYFRILVLVTVLWKECGVRYNPAKIPIDAPLDVADSFIHGIIQGNGGTCASIPVVIAAVGRRLGFPIKLVMTKAKEAEHLFCRWDEEDECFNIDTNNTGLSCHPDDYYRTGAYALTPEQEQGGVYLRSLTLRQELAGFLCQRAHHWLRLGNTRLAVQSLAWASELVPEDRCVLNTLGMQLNRWGDALNARKPPGFPPLWIETKARRHPGLPLKWERMLLGMEATEAMLRDPEQDKRYWELMRRGASLSAIPTEANVHFDGGRCSIGLRVSTVTANKTGTVSEGACHV